MTKMLVMQKFPKGAHKKLSTLTETPIPPLEAWFLIKKKFGFDIFLVMLFFIHGGYAVLTQTI